MIESGGSEFIYYGYRVIHRKCIPTSLIPTQKTKSLESILRTKPNEYLLCIISITQNLHQIPKKVHSIDVLIILA
jgi:hypothetical protein